jgi:3',5'-cyclic AMP phosphodiesterase CpdA
LIVTGDITDDGHEKQYIKAQRALTPFSGRTFVCPGNHDFGAKGNFYSIERARRFDEYLSKHLFQSDTFTGDNTPVVHVLRDSTDEVMVIALDTNLETNHPWDFACGEVGEVQLNSLSTIINDPGASKMTKILIFHHHPFMHGHPFMELKDAKQLIRTIYQRINIVLFGHKHVSKLIEYPNNPMYYLASDNSPGKDFAREIIIRSGDININNVQIR